MRDRSGDVELAFFIVSFWALVLLVAVGAGFWVYTHCRSWAAIEKELQKCVLLCANCHVEEHAKNFRQYAPLV